MADILDELRERYAYARDAWAEVRREGAEDMRFVGGDPWDDADKKARKNRPTVAPEEMGQYFNQVINQLLKNPRGMKFSPRGNGADAAGARFYQNKARETEYRSHAKVAYMAAAENAIQRSYGFLRLSTRYASPYSANQDIWIEDVPDPDMVLPDPDAKRPDSSDMQYCFVLRWSEQREFSRRYQKAKVDSFGEWSANLPDWIKGTKVLEAEYWTISTRERALVLVQVPKVEAAPVELQVFADELEKYPGATVVRELRKVDYPTVRMYLTNGIEILHEQDWPGTFIPIVSCYGKILWVPEGGMVKRKILSMTRFGRDPWKSYCYACSQQLEILAQIPKASVKAAVGQLRNYEKDWAEAPHVPKAYLLYHHKDEDGQPYPEAPSRMEYTQGEYLQATELVKEGFRRAIQSAMGSNFLPTQAQRRNEKSGVALDKIEQSASVGTWHFVDHFNDLVRRTGEIFEDLCDKIHDYRGETAVMEADGRAVMVPINDPANKDAVNTKGDYTVTVSVGPSSDSESEAAADFTETLVSNIQVVAAIAGNKPAAAVFARAVRMRNLGPQGDQLADLIEPPEYRAKDGKPPAPELVAMQQQVQHLTQQLQMAAQEKQAKVVEQQAKLQIVGMQEQGENQRAEIDRQVRLAVAGLDREVKLAVAELAAKTERIDLFLEESRLAGARMQEAAEAAKDRTHEHVQGALDHERAKDLAAQQAAHAADLASQQASLTPPAE